MNAKSFKNSNTQNLLSIYEYLLFSVQKTSINKYLQVIRQVLRMSQKKLKKYPQEQLAMPQIQSQKSKIGINYSWKKNIQKLSSQYNTKSATAESIAEQFREVHHSIDKDNTIKEYTKIQQKKKEFFKEIDNSKINIQQDVLEKELKERREEKIPISNIKYLCCSFCFYEGKFNCTNLEHEFISLLMVDQQQRVGRQDLQNTVCAALNYIKDIVIVIGIAKNLQIVGTKYNSQFVTEFQENFRNIIHESIRPRIGNIEKTFDIKFVPILNRQTHEETGKCIITITVRGGNQNHYIAMERKGYYAKYFAYQAKKTPFSFPLEIEECHNEDIYKYIHRSIKEKGRNRKIHYNMQCQKPRRFVSCKNVASKPLSSFQNITVSELCQHRNIYTNSTFIKLFIQDENTMKESEVVLKKIRNELERHRQPFIIKKVTNQQRGSKKYDKNKQLFVIMHNHEHPLVKNIVSQEKTSINLEYTPVTTCIKLKEFKDSADLNDIKKDDRRFIEEYSKFFPEESLTRFYTINSKKIQKLYYKAKTGDEKMDLTIASFVYILNEKLKYNPQFIDQRTISGPQYNFTFY